MRGPATLLQEYLSDAARRLPGKVALVCGVARWTYGELERRSNAVAAALARGGVRRGDRVVVFAENGVEAVLAFWGVLKADAVACVVNPQSRAAKLAYYLDDTAASALIADDTLGGIFREAAARAPHLKMTLLASEIASLPDAQAPAPRNIDADLAALVYTSGSTGEAKGVMLSHRNMAAATTSITQYLEIEEDEVIACALPLAFDYGLYQMIMAFAAGARLVLERSFALVPQVVARMASEGVTGFPGMPPMFALLEGLATLARADLSRVRYVTSTGANLVERQLRWLQCTFPAARIYSMYGLTECKRCTYLPPGDVDRKPGSVGVAIPNTELWVVGENDEVLGANQVGQLVIRGATVMQGYWRDPEATARRLRPGALPGERVLYTGDLCRLDDEGYVYFVARMDDIIKSRGQKVAPREVESALLGIPGVLEAAVIGVPDPIQGHAIKAFVVVDGGASLSPRAIRDECRRRLEADLVPKHLEIVGDLPRGATGKIDKTALR